MAGESIELMQPSLQALIDAKVVPNDGYHVVVCDPWYTQRQGDSHTQREWEKQGILIQQSYGPNTILREGGEITPFNLNARSKAYRSWKYGASTRQLMQNRPFTLEPSDTIYFGSVVREGMCVAVSGLPPDYDEMLSGWIIDAWLAKWRVQVEQAGFKHYQGFVEGDGH